MQIRRSALTAAIAHAREAFPRECCGILLTAAAAPAHDAENEGKGDCPLASVRLKGTVPFSGPARTKLPAQNEEKADCPLASDRLQGTVPFSAPHPVKPSPSTGSTKSTGSTSEISNLKSEIPSPPVDTVLRAENEDPDHPDRAYRLGRRAHLEAVRLECAGEARIAAYYHSHPLGPATPSRSDAERAAPDSTHVIVGLAEDPPDCAAWRWTGDRFVREPLEVTDNDNADSEPAA